MMFSFVVFSFVTSFLIFTFSKSPAVTFLRVFSKSSASETAYFNWSFGFLYSLMPTMMALSDGFVRDLNEAVIS